MWFSVLLCGWQHSLLSAVCCRWTPVAGQSCESLTGEQACTPGAHISTGHRTRLATAGELHVSALRFAGEVPRVSLCTGGLLLQAKGCCELPGHVLLSGSAVACPASAGWKADPDSEAQSTYKLRQFDHDRPLSDSWALCRKCRTAVKLAQHLRLRSRLASHNYSSALRG